MASLVATLFKYCNLTKDNIAPDFTLYNLNCYYSIQVAKSVRYELFDRYKEPEKYKIEKVEFK